MVQENYMVINTNDYIQQYRNNVNQKFNVRIYAENQFAPGQMVFRDFNITLTEEEDMNVYKISRDQDLPFTHTYGDNHFSRTINYFFSGPNKEFGLISEEGLR